MNTPIFDELKKLDNREKVSFHTPGHKGKNILIQWGDYIPYIDTTELPGTDNLHDPVGVIKESQDLAAKAFGARKTIYSVNGTTGGIYIALATITNPGDTILIQRESHKSIYNGAILNRLNLEYIYTKYNEKYNLYAGIDPNEVELKLKENPNIKAVVITYPNYYGICSNIKKIAEIVHKYDKILLVDEAHGSHFVFSDRLPISSLKAGADIVVQSTHKTLPSFTQTSMIHVGTQRVNIPKLESMSALYQTTSPSYLFMTSLEMARAYMEEEGSSRLNRNIDSINNLMDMLKYNDDIYIFTGDEYDSTIHNKDITKILLGIEGISGTDLSKILMNDYGIYLEMADFYYTLALSSVMNEVEDFERLIEAIKDIANNRPDNKTVPVSPSLPKANTDIPIYEAFYSDNGIVELEKSIGKVSSSFIIPYPPGIPLICPGEKIAEELVDYIRLAMNIGIEIIGLMGYNKEKIKVVT